MTRHRVDGFDVTAEPFGRPRVEQPRAECRSAVGVQRRQRTRVQVVVADDDVAGLRGDGPGLQGAAGIDPRAQPAVEYPHVAKASSGQHPPRPRRPCPVPVVVHDDGRALADAPAPTGGFDASAARQRMAAPPTDGVIAQLVLERDVHRAGDVAALVGGAPVGLGQLPTHVKDGHGRIVGQALRQLRCSDQYGFTSHATIVPSTLTGVSEHAFSTAERQAVYRVIAERRDIRRFVPGAAVPDDVLARLLQAAHAAPSVGLMQPWRFIRITDDALRRRIHELVAQERLQTAHALGPRSDEFLALKVEGILECAELLVVALGDGRRSHVFGRRTLPHMDLASVSCAIQNLWLAARAEGLGVGWVSIFDPVRLGQLLGMPDEAEPVAILCVGPVPEFPDRPALEIDRWAFGRPLAEFVSENGWPTTAGLV